MPPEPREKNRTAPPRREMFLLIAFSLLLAVLGLGAPSFFSAGNLRDVLMAQLPTIVAGVGMTLVIINRQIDISIGSQVAIGGVLLGTLVKEGLPMSAAVAVTLVSGGILGAVNGALVALARLPAIVVTLATLVILREGLRALTQGADVVGIPAAFQWFGMGQTAGQIGLLLIATLVALGFGWGLAHLRAGRAVYAVGSDPDASRLLGLSPARVTFGVFVIMGVLAALAAVLGSVRFAQVQTNAANGFELQVVAAVVVGGTAVSGGRGSIFGTLLGALFLGTIGPALTFLQIPATWEKAIAGAIILGAVAADRLTARRGGMHG